MKFTAISIQFVLLSERTKYSKPQIRHVSPLERSEKDSGLQRRKSAEKDSGLQRRKSAEKERVL